MVKLRPGETLLVMDAARDVIRQVTEGGLEVKIRGPEWCKEEYPDWTERFVRIQKDDNTALYSLQYTAEESDKPLRFSVRGEEMVECFCNGAFVDVSFWGEHRFELKDVLQQGVNDIRLAVTGNAANLYENAGIAFGLA